MYIWNIFKTLIFLLFCSTKFVYSEPKESQESADLTGVDLNLCLNRPTKEYDFFDNGVVELFKAKHGFGFSMVKAVDPKTKNEKIFWKANDSAEFSKSVRFFKYTLSGMFGLSFKLLNGNVKSFYKEKDTNWIEVDPSKSKPISIFIKPLCSTYSYRAYIYQHHARFVANEGFVFKSVVDWLLKKDKNIVWEAANPNEYCNQIILDGLDAFKPTNNITTFYVNGIIKHFTLREKKWVDVYPRIFLHLGIKQSTYDFEYSVDNNDIEYYTANGILGFKGVRFPHPYRFDIYDVDIWAAKNRREYAYKVMLAHNSNGIFVVILLWNGELIILHRAKNSNQWIDHSNEPFSIDELRILGLDLRYLKPPPERKCDKVSQLYFEDQVKPPISDIKVQYPSSEEPSEPVKSSDISESEPSIAPLSQPLKPALSPFAGKINLIVLDINEIYGIIGYNIEYKPNKVIFRARPKYLFRMVKCKDNILWQYKGIDYPYKVIYKEVNGECNVKLYFPDKNKVEPDLSSRFVHHFDPSEIKVDVIRSRKRNLSA